MPSGKKQEKKRLFAKMSREECIALMERLDGGEFQQTLADELGVSRQYISAEYRKYRKQGEHYRLEVPPESKQKLGPQQVDLLHRLVHDGQAPGGKAWDPRTAQAALAQEIGYRPRMAVIRRHLQDWGIWKDPQDQMQFDQDYYDYIESPTYKEIERRERQWAEEQRRLAEKERAAEVPPGDGGDGAGGGKPYAGGGLPGVPVGGGGQAPYSVRAKHGVRRGKHRKGGKRTKPKQRRKKKR